MAVLISYDGNNLHHFPLDQMSRELLMTFKNIQLKSSSSMITYWQLLLLFYWRAEDFQARENKKRTQKFNNQYLSSNLLLNLYVQCYSHGNDEQLQVFAVYND